MSKRRSFPAPVHAFIIGASKSRIATFMSPKSRPTVVRSFPNLARARENSARSTARLPKLWELVATRRRRRRSLHDRRALPMKRREFMTLLGGAAARRAGALLVGGDPFFSSRRQEIVA